MRYGLAALVGVGDLLYGLDRILRGDGLRIVIAVTTYGSISVSITSSQLRPTIGQILRACVGTTLIFIYSLRLTPNANVRIPLLDPLNEVIVVVVLVDDHSVLDIPIEYLQIARIAPIANLVALDVIDIDTVLASRGSVGIDIEFRSVGNAIHNPLKRKPLLRLGRRANNSKHRVRYRNRASRTIDLLVNSLRIELLAVEFYRLNNT